MKKLHANSFFSYFSVFCFLLFAGSLTLTAQTNMTLLGQLDYTQNVNDIWGYVDANGREYALVGTQIGTAIIDLSDPTNPTEVAFVTGVSNTWRDIKVWGNYAYVITEAQTGLLIIDLSNLPNSVATFNSTLGVGYTDSHNIFIDEFGVAYLFGASSTGVGQGTLMVDVAANPTDPPYLGIYGRTINNVDHYIHDGYVRDNIMWGSEIYYGHVSAVDVSDKSNPVILGAQATPGDFTHACWLSDDSQTVFTVDEVNGAFVVAYDVSDPTDIKELDRFQMFPGSNTAPHNIFVKDDFVVLSYYTAGVVVLDASRPDNLILVGHYDTSTSAGPGFSGCWGVYPFFDSGKMIASDRQNGLFVLDANCVRACYLEGSVTDEDTGDPILGAQIEIISGSEPIATTDFLGAYQTGTLNPGTYTVRASANGYVSEEISVTWTANGILEIAHIPLRKEPSCDTPTNLSSANVTTTTAEVSWNVEDDAIQYNLYYKASSDATYQMLSLTTTSFTLTNLMPGTSYSVYVVADCGDSFVSPASNLIFFTTPVICEVPTNIMVNNITGSSATITWSGDSNAQFYAIRYRIVGTSTWTTLNINAESITLQNLVEQTNYEVEVQANCGSGNSSAFSTNASFMTISNCLPPSNLMVSNIINDRAEVSWNGATHAQNYTLRYRLLLSGGGAGNWQTIFVGSLTNYTLTGLMAASDYEVQVQSNCSNDNSVFSNGQLFSTLEDCVAPNNIAVTMVSADELMLSWDAQTFTNNYNIWYRPVGGSWITLSSTTNTITLSNLSSCTSYEYQIQSDCATYTGDFSTIAAATTTCIVRLQLQVFLEGSYIRNGQMMTAQLNDLLPNSQPYNEAPWNYQGTESFSVSKLGLTDWLLIELRSAIAPTTIVAQQAVLLRNNGRLRNEQNDPTVTFTDVVPDDYFIVVRHRNHVDVMSAAPINLSESVTFYDFTTGVNKAMGNEQLKHMDDAYVLRSGDMDGNGVINVTDFNLFTTNAGSSNSYQHCDLNLDRNITVTDFNFYVPNSSHIGVSTIRY